MTKALVLDTEAHCQVDETLTRTYSFTIIYAAKMLKHVVNH